jgi:integrase/recombinase XerD
MKISEAIEGYLRQKRATGLGYKSQEGILAEFRRYVADGLIRDVTANQVAEFLNGRNLSNSSLEGKHRCLRMFFEFWIDRGGVSGLSMPRLQRTNVDRAPVPFIYTRSQVRSLIRATQGNQSHPFCLVSDATLRIVLLTLYGTGATTGEIFWLKRKDLDLKRRLVFLRGNWQVEPRRIPISKDLHDLLGTYLRSEERRRVPSLNVFVTKWGEPLPQDAMNVSFVRLRTRAGVTRIDGEMVQPRMCDLRQTFAVHRISSWIEEQADLNRMLPALSAYMGLGGVASIQRFLFMTPERFKPQLDKLSPFEARKHWRNNSRLMRFLASL